jgi:hypothetical protein
VAADNKVESGNRVFAPLAPLPPGQCVMLTDQTFLTVLTSRDWMDNRSVCIAAVREQLVTPQLIVAAKDGA